MENDIWVCKAENLEKWAACWPGLVILDLSKIKLATKRLVTESRTLPTKIRIGLLLENNRQIPVSTSDWLLQESLLCGTWGADRLDLMRLMQT